MSKHCTVRGTTRGLLGQKIPPCRENLPLIQASYSRGRNEEIDIERAREREREFHIFLPFYSAALVTPRSSH